MISKDNLKALLLILGYTQHKGVFSKTFGAATLEVDTTKESILYPEAQGLIVNERQTCNFSANENFVVFECVNRLLVKGYKPGHIELEPKWKLGHGASGGRADILIKDNAGKPLLIIECKTPGREFDKAWRNTLQDGGQLFSYAQQIPETQFLCLYCSDFVEGESSYQSNIVAYRDNDKYLEDNPSFKAFREPGDAKAKYSVWRDTYKLDYTTKGIFEDNIQPYHIGKDKYSLADLQSISASDQQKKYHEFATILRQHNVSGRENAFDKLVNLFLCKLVDELQHPDDLKFVWKGVAYDSHFDLMDRMQQLYQAGMGKFLNESITYIDQSAVKNAMRFIRQNPDATQKAVWQLFQQQKFFTNNDFSFIDVHNEKLFYQNAEVLLKILQMWQDIRLTSATGHNQFLGDMFEFFLDQGVKQSEGQYFTPMPICRFILMSLPLESIIKSRVHPPKAIDYACGAGHFLTELALQLKPLVARHSQTDMADYHRAIYGMEKEYRLSKVAKVSAFMYGQQEINICYGDALINRHSAFPEIQDNSFDLLVANPPFSVRGFLETLPEEERSSYTLTDAIEKLDTNNSIETFFIERAKQLLKAGGVAGIILPASVLSNGGRIYTRTREILLQYFDIVAIADFGSGTFGKTGTNTVTLFLRRKATAPDTADHYRERVNEWFASDNNQPIYRDAHLIDQYAAHIGTASDDYKTLLTGSPNASLLAHYTFVQYRTAFDVSTEIVNLKKQKGFKARPHAEQQTELDKRFLAFAQGIERDKLLHFVLASQQPNRVLIIKSPGDTKAQKQFLGYDWSSAKGDEGIKIIRDASGHHLTPLYDETNRDNPAKISRCIADNFDGRLAGIPPELAEYANAVRLVDMQDFSRVTFEKQIVLSTKKAVIVQSKWPLKTLQEVAVINPSKTELRKIAADTVVSFVEMSSVSEAGFIATQEDRTLSELKGSYTYFADDDIILAKITPCMENGKCALAKELTNGIGMGSSEFHVIRASKETLLPGYAFTFLNRTEIRQVAEKNMTGASGHRRVPESFYSALKIPLPPLEIQQQIVSECEAVDSEAATAQAAIDSARHAIETTVNSVVSSNCPVKKLGDICKMQAGKFVSASEIADQKEENMFPCYGGNGLRGFTKTFTHDGTYPLIGRQGALCGNINKADGKFHATEHAVVVTPNPDINVHWLYYQLKSLNLNQYATGAAQPGLSVKNILVVTTPVPPLAEQQRLVAEVEKLEKSIAEAQAVIAAVPARKQAIMQRYL